MYQVHPNLTTPDPSQTIWRYLSFDRFVSLITSGSLFFAKPDALGDRWEGWYPDQYMAADTPLQLREQASRHRVRWAEPLRSELLFNCWHMGEDENYPMWKAYAAAGSGIAVRSTIGHLIASFGGLQRSIYVGEVSYPRRREPHAMDQTNFIPPFFVKRPEFASEREVRVLAGFQLLNDESELVVRTTADGQFVPVNLSELIQEVVVAPQRYEDWGQSLKTLLQSSGLEDSLIRRSRLEDEHPYSEHLLREQIRSRKEQAFVDVSDVCRECFGPFGEQFSEALQWLRTSYFLLHGRAGAESSFVNSVQLRACLQATLEELGKAELEPLASETPESWKTSKSRPSSKKTVPQPSKTQPKEIAKKSRTSKRSKGGTSR